MKDQAEKHRLGLAGEFLVAGELLRRGYSAAVTYGNAKKADVVAVRGNFAVTIEVKTTAETRWIVGNRLPEVKGSVWVFVYLPKDESPAEFFVLTSHELRQTLEPAYNSYREKYLAKHGKEFSGAGVEKLNRADAERHRNRWDKIDTALESSEV